MCGIAGFVDFGGHAVEAARMRLRRMTDVLVHRGPDASGFYVDEVAALGHRRLSIIDVSTGQQPMSAAGGRMQIVFNGEIYNFLELRKELEGAGHRFATRSDTEVILAAYLQWGERCAERLNGMFAFAIWDKEARRLFLARDRVGKKPLYYYRNGSSFAFASELKALRAAAFTAEAIDAEALDCYFTFGYVPAPRTIFRDVHKLRAAHALTVSESGETLRRYWRLQFSEGKERPLDDAVDEFESLLSEAVRCRLMSEVPLGAFLSGGLDSSLVVAAMGRTLDRPVSTYTIGFREGEYSETDTARAIARHLRTEHREEVVRPQAADALPRIAWHCDEPFADSSALPTWYVCEMTRRSVTVALSGDGGDEAFAGYTFRYIPHMLEAGVRRWLPPAIRQITFGPLGRVWPASARLPRPLRLRSIFQNLAVGDAEAYARDLAWLPEAVRSQVYRPDFHEILRGFTPFEVVTPYYSASGAPDALARSQAADIQMYMTDDVLVKVDRMSMAHSIEVRSPLLDHRVLEFAAGLPASLKTTLRRGKLPLRRLAQRWLPQEVHGLPKRGFSIPAARWLREDLRELVESVLFRSGGVIADCLDQRVLRALWQEHLNGQRDHNVFLWGVMMLGLWEAETGQRRRLQIGKAA